MDTHLQAHLKQKGYDTDAPVHLKGGRSNLVFRIGGQVLKVFDQTYTNPLFANDPQREISALRSLAGQKICPALIDFGTFQGRFWLIYTHVDGSIWTDGIAPVSELLFSVHRAQIPPDLPRGSNGSKDLLRQTEYILSLLRGVHDLQRLRPKSHVAATEQLALVHGDPVPGNLLRTDNGLRLIDWQCPAIGDPCEDLALFLSPAMQLIYRGTPLSAEAEHAFLSAYPDQAIVTRYLAIRPWYHWRMAAYCAWRSERDGGQDIKALQLELAKLQALNAI